MPSRPRQTKPPEDATVFGLGSVSPARAGVLSTGLVRSHEEVGTQAHGSLCQLADLRYALPAALQAGRQEISRYYFSRSNPFFRQDTA